MLLGKGIKLWCAEVTGQHRAAEGDDIMQCQQPKLDNREIAVAANQQGILLLAFGQPCQSMLSSSRLAPYPPRTASTMLFSPFRFTRPLISFSLCASSRQNAAGGGG
jgi:hypothetical protein